MSGRYPIPPKLLNWPDKRTTEQERRLALRSAEYLQGFLDRECPRGVDVDNLENHTADCFYAAKIMIQLRFAIGLVAPETRESKPSERRGDGG